MLPFLERHVALANPDLLVLMGNVSCQAVLGQKGITRLRGTWAEALGKPVLPMFHPAYVSPRLSVAKTRGQTRVLGGFAVITSEAKIMSDRAFIPVRIAVLTV